MRHSIALLRRLTKPRGSLFERFFDALSLIIICAESKLRRGVSLLGLLSDLFHLVFLLIKLHLFLCVGISEVRGSAE